MNQQRRTKIIATLGPSTDDPGVLRECLEAGLDIARLNAAHGSEEEMLRRIKMLRKAAIDAARPVGLLIDLPGPKFRLGSLSAGQKELRPGEFVKLEASRASDSTTLPIRDAGILAAIKAGHLLHLADGTVTLRAMKKAGGSVKCRVVIGGIVRSGSGINLPDTDVSVTIPTFSDLRWISLAASQKAEWIGVSFVRNVQDVERVRRAFSHFRFKPRVIAKIEKPQALANLDALLREADGLMVARGDLGVEIPLAQVPLAQKKIIARANEMGKPVITATQMLESMVAQRQPTRAEVADVANAVLDGTDAVMLSAETAIGQYPVEAIRILGSVLTATEEAYPFNAVLEARARESWSTTEDAISLSACRLAWDSGAKAIIISSCSGLLPYNISRFRPLAPIIVLTDKHTTIRQLSLGWGIQAVFANRGESPEPARRWLLANHLARAGNSAVWIRPAGKTKNDRNPSIQLVSL